MRADTQTISIDASPDRVITNLEDVEICLDRQWASQGGFADLARLRSRWIATLGDR